MVQNTNGIRILLFLTALGSAYEKKVVLQNHADDEDYTNNYKNSSKLENIPSMLKINLMFLE